MQTNLSPNLCRAFLGYQVKKAIDELTLSKKIISCHPSSLPLPDHVDCFVAFNRSPSRLEFSEALLGVHPTFDASMILFENVVQVLHRSLSTAVRSVPSFLTVGDRGAVDRRQVSVDHSRLQMESLAERLAKQPFGSIGVRALTAKNRWCPPWNRWPDTSSTSIPPRGLKSRRPATTCLSA
jgi:hypothetical protein